MAKNDKKNENIENQEMDWDSGISAEATQNEFNLPPIGDYEFKIIEFERTFSKSGKPMAKLNLQLNCDGQLFRVYDYLVLQQSMEWRLAAFFECIGLKKKNESLTRMPWEKVLNAHGRVKIKHEDYNGQTNVKVEKYLPSVASSAPSSPDAPVEGSMPFEI